ncbi:hypothetical protein KM043_004006 [Ampulex compressa]|nr:hypothetical protein KM043_004006 [Ampulex compressa]
MISELGELPFSISFSRYITLNHGHKSPVGHPLFRYSSATRFPLVKPRYVISWVLSGAPESSQLLHYRPQTRWKEKEKRGVGGNERPPAGDGVALKRGERNERRKRAAGRVRPRGPEGARGDDARTATRGSDISFLPFQSGPISNTTTR